MRYEHCVAYTTVNSKEDATALARALVGRGCVACACIVGPVESVYMWQGQLEQSPEWMLMLKCMQEQVVSLKAAIAELHSYELPELIVLPVVDGHPPYLNWLEQAKGSFS